MHDVELRDVDQARQWLCLGLGLQRTLPLGAAHVRAALSLALELASDGQPLPPTGYLGDLLQLLIGRPSGTKPTPSPTFHGPLMRKYEDLVVGKILSDRSFDRAADAVRPLKGRERIRAAAFVAQQIRERAGTPGVLLSPAVVKALIELPGTEVVVRANEALPDDHPIRALLTSHAEGLIAAFRAAGDLLGPEDVFELEHGTATAEFGQRLALRQVIQTAARFGAELTGPPPRRTTRREAPTRLTDEDAYPVGGFASISNRGSVESMLHSQLAYMDPAGAERPDLFDVHYLRDELLYYSRDENQFFRERRRFTIAFAPELTAARFKDPALPVQRIVLTQGFVVAAVHKLLDWLDTQEVRFTLAFPVRDQTPFLAAEKHLFEVVFREAMETGNVRLVDYSADEPPEPVAGERTLCIGRDVGDSLRVDATPSLRLGDEETLPAATGWEAWSIVLRELLAAWV